MSQLVESNVSAHVSRLDMGVLDFPRDAPNLARFARIGRKIFVSPYARIEGLRISHSDLVKAALVELNLDNNSLRQLVCVPGHYLIPRDSEHGMHGILSDIGNIRLETPIELTGEKIAEPQELNSSPEVLVFDWWSTLHGRGNDLARAETVRLAQIALPELCVRNALYGS